MTDASTPFFVQALDALKAGDRRRAANLLARELGESNTALKNLPSVARLAEHIGEVELAIEASRRSVVPGSIESQLAHWAVLATHGRSNEALDDLRRQPARVRDHPWVLHFRGTVANQFGQFDEAEALFRRVLSAEPAAMQTWFTLAMLKRFEAGDPDIEAMDQLDRRHVGSIEARASLRYALGKASEDVGEVDRAFAYYSSGAALRSQQGGFDHDGYRRAAERVMRDFTGSALSRLVPSQYRANRSLFVTGMPRSGTTLTEQMLVAHSAVGHGAELNLAATALIPTMGMTVDGATAYERRAGIADPWGAIGEDYSMLVEQRFRASTLVVDKSLGQSLLTGLLLHALPDARIAWLQRAPEDVALSCFRNYFSTGLKWTWSLAGIARFMRTEDELFAHWKAVFGDRMLTVPYEQLVADPDGWNTKLHDHFGLPAEIGTAPGKPERAITTASSVQVRQPVSTARIGQAAKFERHLKPFRDLYYG